MFVFKFGGASVKSAEAVKNIVEILQRYDSEEIVVVVSAMGKTTNLMEKIIECYAGENKKSFRQEFDAFFYLFMCKIHRIAFLGSSLILAE